MNASTKTDRLALMRLRKALAWLPCVVLALCGLGTAMVYSASAIRGERMGWSMYFLERQIIWLGLGMAALGITSRLDYRRLARLDWLSWALAAAGLGGVLIGGAVVNGARRWFRLGSLSFQPSEVAKLLLVIAVAGVLARLGASGIRRWGGVFVTALVALVPVGLIAVEPDLGTAVLVCGVLLSMVYIAGARVWHIFTLLLPLAPLGGFYMVNRFGHIMGRLNAFWEGGSTGKAYHAYMSVQSLASGGLTGAGPGSGWAKLHYLPEAHTDFVFSVLGQEWGLAGTLFVTTAFAILVACGWLIVRHAADRFGMLLAFGVTMMIGLQAAFNIAVVTASIPTKGISLPFISFGGSGMVCALAMVGLLISVGRVTLAELADGKPLQSTPIRDYSSLLVEPA